MKNNILLFSLLFSLMSVLSSCDKEDPDIPNEEEVITTLTYTLTPEDGGSPVIMMFKDLDGDGGSDPVITGGTLLANSSYNGSIELLNETETPAERVTEEIEEEDKEHQFFFQTGISGLNVAYDDQDGDGNPVGLKTKVTTGEASTGTLKITLRHEPIKDGAEVADGDITNASGETEIEVSFPIDVE